MKKIINNNEYCNTIINSLYDGTFDLRQASARIVEQCYSNELSVNSILPLIKWVRQHLEGIPFSSIYNSEYTGDYNPTRPYEALECLYELLEFYNEEGKKIDSVRTSFGHNGEFDNIPAGEEGLSEVINSQELYNLYKSGWFIQQADIVRININSNTITPSQALNVLIDNFKYYTRPTQFSNINMVVEYCIYCVYIFPDSESARKEFIDVVQQIYNNKNVPKLQLWHIKENTL